MSSTKARCKQSRLRDATPPYTSVTMQQEGPWGKPKNSDGSFVV